MLLNAITVDVTPAGTMTKDGPDTGGEPTVIAECVECGHIYSAQETEDDEYRPVGTDGACQCGSNDFKRAIRGIDTDRFSHSEQ